MSGLITACILLSVALLAGGYAISTYNRLISEQRLADSQWSRMNGILKQKSAAIPGLVEAARDGNVREKLLLRSVTEALTRYLEAESPDDSVKAASELSTAMERFFAMTEHYPALRSSRRFADLKTGYDKLETRDGRRFFNETVTRYNRLVITFPSSVVAGFFRFEQRPLFRSAAGEDPVVRF